MYSQIAYLYRDGANYKYSGVITLDGHLTSDQIEAITRKLDGEEFFIPFDLKLGIPELQSEATGFPTEDDHVWHTLYLDEIASVDTLSNNTQVISVAKFVEAFANIPGPNGWDEAGAMRRLGL